MKAIMTKYYGPGNVKGSRIIAATMLAGKMKWKGNLNQGYSEEYGGYVHVFEPRVFVTKGLPPLLIRFFVYDDEIENEDGYGGDIRECDELEFIACEYDIRYERNTVRENGVSQICLTKMPKG